MKKISRWKWLLIVGLVGVSVTVYLIHYAIFRDPHHIFKFLIEDLAFVPIEVLVVALVIDELLRGREKRNLMNKLNMVIGAFFSEVGTISSRRFRISIVPRKISGKNSG